MDEYSKRCIDYLTTHNPELLQKYLTRCGVSSVEELTAIIPQKPARRSVYQCQVCKKHDVSFMEKQTRSADEGASVYFLCNSCGHQWRQS